MTIQTSSFYDVLACVASAFTIPSFQNFTEIALGWLFSRDRHLISRALRVRISVGLSKHFSVFYRFFSKARWVPDVLGKLLFEQLLPFIPGSTLFALVDDTLCRKTGPHVWGAGMHHDAVASTYGRNSGKPAYVAFAFGHSWVILAVWVPLPWNFLSGVAIPVLIRLYRSKKLTDAKAYRKRTALALEMVNVFRDWVLGTGRRVTLLGDCEYSCRTIMRHLPQGFEFIGPAGMDAALFAEVVPQGKRRRGAPRRRGDRLPTPAQLIADPAHPWVRRKVTIYRRSVVVLTKTLVCQWWRVAGQRPGRIVITRDPKGRLDDRVFFCTDPTVSVEDLITMFARRWCLEVTFFNVKQHLGLEHPQNGWGRRRHRRRGKKRPGPQPWKERGRKAVERTIPFVLYLFGLIHLWYFERGTPQKDVSLARRLSPWNRHKTEPSFADMLGALRRDLAASPEFSKDPVGKRFMRQFGSVAEALMNAA